jgi:preprotein translocase subunit SecG
MSRKFEKALAFIGAVWQIGTGLFTMLFYGTWIRGQVLEAGEASVAEVMSSKVVAKNLYSFTVTFGIFFVIVGVVNLYCAYRLNAKTVDKKIPIWFIICSLISFFCMDIIGCIAFMAAGIVALARNKSIAIMEIRRINQ